MKHLGLKVIVISFSVMVIPLLFAACSKGREMTVASPDGNLLVEFKLHAGRPSYAVSKGELAIIDSSRVGLRCREFELGRNAKLGEVKYSDNDKLWSSAVEKREIRDRYNEMRVELCEKGSRPIFYSIVFRVYDEGVGFRYEIPEQEHVGGLTIEDELTEFSLAEDGVAWPPAWNNDGNARLHHPSLISHIDTVCAPLTVKLTDSCYVAIHETMLNDYAPLNLRGVRGTKLASYLTPPATEENVTLGTPFSSPWRTLIVAANPDDLKSSRLLLQTFLKGGATAKIYKR